MTSSATPDFGPRVAARHGELPPSTRSTSLVRTDFGPLARKYGIIGTPAQCAETLERFVAGGCNYVLMNPICDSADERAQLETIAGEIIPARAMSSPFPWTWPRAASARSGSAGSSRATR